MNKVDINLWGRDFSLNAVLHCFDGEIPSEIQKEALAGFTPNTEELEKAYDILSKYVLNNGGKDIGIIEVDNIFKYVMPKIIIIPRTKTKIVAIMCNFKFDPEQGIAVVFENAKFKEVGVQDIIL